MIRPGMKLVNAMGSAKGKHEAKLITWGHFIFLQREQELDDHDFNFSCHIQNLTSTSRSIYMTELWNLSGILLVNQDELRRKPKVEWLRSSAWACLSSDLSCNLMLVIHSPPTFRFQNKASLVWFHSSVLMWAILLDLHAWMALSPFAALVSTFSNILTVSSMNQ